MAANVQIDIKATDKASPAINSVNKSVSSMAKNAKDASLKFTEFNSMMQIATQVIRVAGQAYNMTVGEAQKYNLAMVDMARKMGTTTEEASRLVQVGDDVRLSQEQISLAMTFAIRNGIEPNINGLAKLADEYTKLTSPVEKGQLLLKSFGRSGMEMGKLLEKGGQGIRDMSAAIEDGLIVTEEGAKNSQRYFEALDRLSDSAQSVKVGVGNTMIPLLANAAEGFMVLKQAVDEATFSLNPFVTIQNAFAISAEQAAIAEGYETKETGLLANALKYADATTVHFARQHDRLKTDLANSASAARYTAQAIYSLGEDAVISRDQVKGLNQQIDKLKSRNIWITTYLQTVNLGGGMTAAMNTSAQSWTEQYWAWKGNKYGQTNYESPITTPTTTPKPKKKATGGMTSGMTWVGEQGPELIDAPSGSRVFSNKESNQMSGIDYNRLRREIVRGVRDGLQRS